MREPRADLTQVILSVVFVGLLTGLSLWILRPFMVALIWASAIVVATWPLLIILQRRFGGRRLPAAALMTLALLLLLLLPVGLAASAITGNVDIISGWVKAPQELRLPSPPAWLVDLPLIGTKLNDLWLETARTGLASLLPYASQAGRWLAVRAGDAGGVLVQSMLSVVIAAVLYMQGDATARGLMLFFRRLGGDRGERALLLAAQATRGIALGVIVTAAAQSLLAAIGLLVASVPYVGLLTVLIFMLCIAQIGPTLVMLPAVIWMYADGSSGRATVLLVFTIVAGTMDNFLRPFLIKMGADLPLLLIFAGVIGGLISLGLVGIFVGPVVLAVTYRLLEEWVREGREVDRSTLR